MAHSLSLEDISKRYGRGTPIIDGLSHTFEPGTATGLTGPNGSGKTTLLRILFVESYPTSGHVRYGDINVHDTPHQYLQHVGIVHAEAALPEYLSAVELLEWILRSRGKWDDTSGPERIDDMLNQLLLDERRENLIGTYSSGMVQKTQIAAALIHEPSVLLMDEPFRSLDEETKERSVQMLEQRKEAGSVLVVASHLDASLQALVDGQLQMGQRVAQTG